MAACQAVFFWTVPFMGLALLLALIMREPPLSDEMIEVAAGKVDVAEYRGSTMTDHWHGTLRHVRGAELSGDTNQTSGMTRLEAISGKTVGSTKVWMGQTHVAPHTNSGDHHHGATETAIYVVSGRPSFVFADGDNEIRIDTEPGDYIFVPPYAPHREENPTGEPAVVVIARSSQEAVVVNLPSLWTPVDRGNNGSEGGADRES